MKRGARYSLQEIVILVRSNPGYGLHRLVKMIYFPNGTDKSQRQSVRYADALECLTIHRQKTGEDLYDLIQSPDYSTLVTENEYREITGLNIPRGHGRGGGRTRKGGRRIDRDVRHKMTMIPLPPQDFNWAEITPLWDRG